MTTTGPTDPNAFDLPHDGSDPGGTFAPTGGTNKIDPHLIQQTKNEIRLLVREIQQLAQSDIPPDQYYEAFLRRVVQALASQGGAFWTVNEDGGLKLEYQVNMPRQAMLEDSEAMQRHTLLLQNVLASGQATLVPPQSGSSSAGEAGNPSDYLLVLAVIRVDQEIRGIVEIFQRAGGGPTTQRGYLRFLVQMSESAGDFLKNRRLRHLGDRETLWENLEQFLASVHRGLDVEETAFTIVNESRRLIGCDRVSLTLRKGRKEQVVSISGLDTLDRRAEQVQQLGRLASVVNRTGQPFWYTGGQTPLAPQIETPLHDYLDQSHATMLAVLPIFPDNDSTEATAGVSRRAVPIGALIIEQLEDSHFHDGFQDRVETVARHSSTALTNALNHENLFLMPVWRALGRARLIREARLLPKALIGLLLIAAIVISLFIVPASFQLGARGRLQPAVRREIFAPLDGVVIAIHARHEQRVSTNTELAELSNDELSQEILNLMGRKGAIEERIRAVKRSQLNRHLRLEEQNRLNGELDELVQVELGIDSELALLRQKQDLQVIRSPLDGRVVTWNVDETLWGRPVQRGQVLMTIVDPDGAWELELDVPEQKMGHIRHAQRTAAEPLAVTFVLASHPDRKFEGRVIEMAQAAEVQSAEGNTVRVRVAIDRGELPELRTGTTVRAKVHCGRKPIGYVVFHELIETVQRNVLFWL